MAEPCLICTPVDQVPEEVRELARYMQREFPPATHLMHVEIPPGRPGLYQCWNCEGRGTVRPVAVELRERGRAELVGQADKRVVFDLLEDLRQAWERILNSYHKRVGYVNGLMAVHNFHKLALDHIVEEACLPPKEAAMVFAMARTTFVKAMEERIRQLELPKEGEHGKT